MSDRKRPAWVEDLPPANGDRRGRSAGSKKNQFQPGNKMGGRKRHADVWELLQRAAEIATARAKASDNSDAAEVLTGEEMIASLIETVRRTDPATALRVMIPHIVPKAQFKPVKIEVDFDDLEGTLQRIAAEMADGGDLASLNALFNTVKTVQEARAMALEIRLSEKELFE